MDLAYHFSPSAARVIIPDTGPVAIASQGAPAPDAGAVEILASFSVAFAVDATGTGVTTIPISYPIAVGGVAGTFASFDAQIDYTSALSGFLGTSELHFAFAGPGGSPLTVLSGTDLVLPSLLPGDTLTLSGYFSLMADGFPGGSTEIEVFGAVPEPSTWLLACTGIASATVMLRSRRQTRR
ncbi:MAG: PEP-CTERM sorting domain-containing protein [Pirellulaceae bacterium]